MKYRFKTEEEMQFTNYQGRVLESGWRGRIPYGWSGDMDNLLGKPLFNFQFKQDNSNCGERVGTVRLNENNWLVHDQMVVPMTDNVLTKVEEFTKENVLAYSNMPIQIKGDDNGTPFMFSSPQLGVIFCHSDKLTITINTNDNSAKIKYAERIDKKELVSVNKLLSCLFTENISIEDNTSCRGNVLITDKFKFEMLCEYDCTADFFYEPIKTKGDVTFF